MMEVPQKNAEIFELKPRRTDDAPFSTHVKTAIDHYFAHLNGYDVVDLYEIVMSEVEKPLLEAVLEHTGHNQTKAAKALGLSRSTLRKKLDQYHIS
jgi:Fis family transcriptional regulator, factor for inversion stimulation protein